MSEQKHIIKRQRIELTVSNAAIASEIQDEISRVYRQRVVPLIDQYCTELGAPDRLYRIDSLEVDLGTLDAQDLEEQFVAQIKATLRKALAEQISQHEEVPTAAQNPKTRSALELFALFASTGSLPWWADHHQPDLLSENLRQLLEESPAAFAQLLRELLRDKNVRQRIVNQYSDTQLSQVCGLLTPALRGMFAQETSALMSALQKTIIHLNQTWPSDGQLQRTMSDQPLLPAYTSQKTTAVSAQMRQSIWRTILQVAASVGQEYATREAFSKAVLERMAKEAGRSLPAEWRTIAFSQPEKLDNHPGQSPAERKLTTRTPKLTQRLQTLQASSQPALAAAWAALQAGLPSFSAALRGQVRKALTQTGAASPRQAAERILSILKTAEQTELTRSFESALAVADAAEGELTTLLRRLQSRGGALAEVWAALRGIALRLPATVQTYWLTMFTAAGSLPSAEDILQLLNLPAAEHGLRPEERNHLLNLLREEPAPVFDLHFSAADEVTITNAGLVILWPFLNGFFGHLGLLEERDFKDLSARQRAVGLLQALATGQDNFPEYLLPLNKLLCGLDVAHPFEFGPPLQKREAKECNSLLKAVIAQAPILGKMSVDGFRGSFLLRPGLLTTQSGHWLLRVEHQTFDIVLERFPWNWEWIRLPWMQAPLRVEWALR